MSHKIAQNSLDFSGDWSVTVPDQVGKSPWPNRFSTRRLSPVLLRSILAFRGPQIAEACASAGKVPRALPSPHPMRGSWQWQHMVLSLTPREGPNGYQAAQTEIFQAHRQATSI
jgi:hypothetical protein